MNIFSQIIYMFVKVNLKFILILFNLKNEFLKIEGMLHFRV